MSFISTKYLSRCFALALACASLSTQAADCNTNGVVDATEIATTPALDVNRDGILDCCPNSSVINSCSTNVATSLIPGESVRMGYAIDRLSSGKIIMSDGPFAEPFVYIYDPVRQEDTIIANPAPTNVSSYAFGKSLSMLPDGGFLVSDGRYGSSSVVYRYLSPEMTPVTISSPGSVQEFGRAMIPFGANQYVISSPIESNAQGQGTGAVYLFNSNNTVKVRIANPGTYQNGENFGESLAMLGTNRIVIGAPRHEYGTNSSPSGIVYIYDIAQASLVATIQNPQQAQIYNFGHDVAAIGTNYFVVGGSYGFNQGIRMYDRNGTLVRAFANSTGTIFAASIAAIGNDLIAIGDPNAGRQGGQVYVYTLCGNLKTVLYPPTSNYDGDFGNRIIPMGSGAFAVTADGENHSGYSAAGVVHLYNVSTGTDCNANGVLDSCETDTDGDGVINACEVFLSAYATMHVQLFVSATGTRAMTLISNYTWRVNIALTNNGQTVASRFIGNGLQYTDWGDANQTITTVPISGIADTPSTSPISIVSVTPGTYRYTFNEQTRQYTVEKIIVNMPPVANAGANQTVASAGGTLWLNGGASSDSDGTIVSYAWQQVSGPAVSIGTPSAPVTTAVIPPRTNAATYIFSLRVTDNAGAFSTGTVSVTQSSPPQLKTYSTMHLRPSPGFASVPMSLVSNYVWKIDVTFGSSATERFKFDVIGDWSVNFGDNNSDNIADQSGSDIMIRQGAGRYTILFNDQTKQYWVIKHGNGFVNISVVGSFNGWNPAVTNMSLVDANTWQGTLTFNNYSGASLKFIANNSWTTNWGEANQSDLIVPVLNQTAEKGASANIRINGTLNGRYLFTFNSLTFAYRIEALIVDCNSNGISDTQDIASGFSQDCDGNGIPDTCEPIIDVDADGVRDACDPLVSLVCSSHITVSTGASNCCGNASLTVQIIGNGNTSALQIRNSFNAQQTATMSSCFPLGQSTVTFTVTDGVRQTNTCTTTITVEDRTPPVFTSFPAGAQQ